MSTDETRKGNDEQALDEVARAWSDMGGEQPPELVDLAVMNRARAAVQQQRPWFWNMSWVHGLSTAAVLAIALTLLLQLRQAAEPQLPGQNLPAAPPPLAVDEVSAQDLHNDNPAPAVQYRAKQSAVSPATGSDEPVGQVMGDSGVSADTESREVMKTEREQDVRLEETAPVPGLRGDALESKRDADQAAEVTAARERQAATVEPLMDDVQDKAATASPATTAEPAGLMVAEPVSEHIAPSDEDPEAWLDRIRALKEAGEDEAAAAALEAFQQTFPDHPLPADLADG